MLSASSAKRWINCPPSARLSEEFPESTSDYAEEGTLAHDICELKLRKLFIEPGMSEKTFKTAHNQLKKHGQYDPEMERYTDEYVDYIQKIAYSYPVPPKIVIEKEVHYGHVARDGYGFSDCIILSGTGLPIRWSRSSCILCSRGKRTSPAGSFPPVSSKPGQSRP